jgi:UPF0755 protein
VLKPAKSNDLFFVADGTGGHAFADSFAEHQRNVAKWRRIERERDEEQPAPAASASKTASDPPRGFETTQTVEVPLPQRNPRR